MQAMVLTDAGEIEPVELVELVERYGRYHWRDLDNRVMFPDRSWANAQSARIWLRTSAEARAYVEHRPGPKPRKIPE